MSADFFLGIDNRFADAENRVAGNVLSLRLSPKLSLPGPPRNARMAADRADRVIKRMQRFVI
jgi:hypothetical protein